MKRIIITGGNSGIGYQSCLQLARLGHRIIMICRNENAAIQACSQIKSESSNENISYLIADLSEMQSVKTVATHLSSQYETIDVLINNAAEFDLSNKIARFNSEGVEKQFATNVIAPFLLSEMLMPIIRKSKGKIINIATKGLMAFPNLMLDFENINGERSYNAGKTYYQNKLALLMVTLWMKEAYCDVTFHAIRVTNVKIDMNRYPNISSFLKSLYKIKAQFSISLEEMAKTYVALSLDDYEGFLYDENMKEVKANKSAYNKDGQRRLYELLVSYK